MNNKIKYADKQERMYTDIVKALSRLKKLEPLEFAYYIKAVETLSGIRG